MRQGNSTPVGLSDLLNNTATAFDVKLTRQELVGKVRQ
jgi:hypothetical protein